MPDPRDVIAGQKSANSPSPPPEKGQGIGQTRIKIGIYRNYKVKKARNSNFKM